MYMVAPEAGCISPDFSGTPGTFFCPKATDLDFTFWDLGMVRYNYHPAARLAVLGIVLAVCFDALKIKGGIIMSIVIVSFIGINYVHCTSLNGDANCVTNLAEWAAPGPKYIVDVSNIPSGKLSFKYAKKPLFWEAVFTFLFVEMFDSFGTLSGIMQRCGFMKGDPERAMTRVNRAMCVDGLGLWLGGIIGANSITCYIESNTGVEAGARTGLASIVTGSAFLLSLLFIQPFVTIIPDAATCCALVMVGIYSLADIQEVNFKDFVDQATAFLIIATMGFTYSIANGISVGFIFYSWMRMLRFVWALIKSKIWPGSVEEVPLPPHIIIVLGAVFSIFRFAYLGDFMIHGSTVAPE